MSLQNFHVWKRSAGGRLFVREDHTPVALFGNLHVRVEDKDHPGITIREHHQKNTVTNFEILVDLINGTSADHLDSGSDLRIQDSGGALIKTIGTQRSGFPTTAAGALITLGWEDLTTDAYNPDDLFMRTPALFSVAETLNVPWSNKLSSENWFFDWDLSASGTGFQTAGLNGMMDALTGGAHFDGTEGASNMRIEVFDPTVSEFFQNITEASTQPTSSQLRFTFDRAGGSNFWRRVETQFRPNTNAVWFDDDITDQTQTIDDIFQYELTVSFS